VFKHERETAGESRMTPQLIRTRATEIKAEDEDEFSKQYVNYALSQLTAAGWLKKIADGLYEFQVDPRDN